MYIVAIQNDTRKENACELQDVLTDFGDNITTRLGIHDPDEKNKGIIIVTYIKEDIEKFVETLNSIDGVEAKFM
jgi:metal-responsive CopG/Arc/MetJ family transcriptional regulator